MTFIEFLQRNFYMTELFLCQMVLLYSYPKRGAFVLRYAVGVLASMTAYFFIHEYVFDLMASTNVPLLNMLYGFLMFGGATLMSIATAVFAFRSSVGSLVSACAGGSAIQHIAYQFSALAALLPFVKWESVYLELLFNVVACVICYFLLGKRLAKAAYYKNYDKKMFILAIVIILISNVIYRFYRVGGTQGVYVKIGVSAYAIVSCSLALFVQFFSYDYLQLKSENAMLERIAAEEKKQYEISKANIDILNIKCHDLKRELELFGNGLPKEEVNYLQGVISEYDSHFSTGQKVLDVILNEKNYRANKEGITLNFFGNGEDVNFMQTMEIYSLFGNAIENAVEAVKKLKEEGKRTVSVTLTKKQDFVCIKVSNYFNGEITIENGLPLTSKKEEVGYHGYGIKSMRAVANKYGGDLSVTTERDIFHLEIFMLCP